MLNDTNIKASVQYYNYIDMFSYEFRLSLGIAMPNSTATMSEAMAPNFVIFFAFFFYVAKIQRENLYTSVITRKL